jgi:hypothetical protein
MGTAELKLDIINRIANLKETYIIEEIKRILDFEEEAYKVNDEQRKRLAEAKTDKVLTEAEANSEIEKWLSER